MKKLINDVRAVVPEMLAGLARAHPGIALVEGEQIAVRADLEALRARGEVALISGGGSGHEPAHAGYVGRGHAVRGGGGRRVHLAQPRRRAGGDPRRRPGRAGCC